jgi:hypothetical protein
VATTYVKDFFRLASKEPIIKNVQVRKEVIIIEKKTIPLIIVYASLTNLPFLLNVLLKTKYFFHNFFH